MEAWPVSGNAKRKAMKPTPTAVAAPRWKLEDAKARFSELVRRARAEGPQCVTVYGKDAVVVVATDEYDRLRARVEQPTLHALLSNSPLRDLEFGETGEKSPVREVDL